MRTIVLMLLVIVVLALAGCGQRQATDRFSIQAMDEYNKYNRAHYAEEKAAEEKAHPSVQELGDGSYVFKLSDGWPVRLKKVLMEKHRRIRETREVPTGDGKTTSLVVTTYPR